MASILAIVAMLVPYIPVLLSIVGWALKFFGASKENLEKYQEMVQKNKDSGLISVETYTKLTDFHSQMVADLEKKTADAEKKPQP